MDKQEAKQKVDGYIKEIKDNKLSLQLFIFNYCKTHGLIPATEKNSDGFPYKKYIREVFNSEI